MEEIKADLEAASSLYRSLKGSLVAYLDSGTTRAFIETEGDNEEFSRREVVRSALTKQYWDLTHLRDETFFLLREQHRTYFRQQGRSHSFLRRV